MYETTAEVEAFFKCLYQFRLVKKLGEGHFGIAVLAFDIVEKDHKVFKLPKDARTTEALCQEGENLKALQQLSHPNIIRLNQYGVVPLQWNGAQEERYYLNMAFGGTSLRTKLGPLRYELDENSNAVYHGSGKRLPPEEMLRIAIDCCRGIEAAHGFQGAPVRMLHRDISPDNILIDDITGVARLADFGIARVIDRSSAFGSIAGKLIYMDPECFLSRATVQSDLYSLAIVMYEAAAGNLPFANYQRRVESRPVPLCEVVPEVPVALSNIVQRALDPDVKVRFRNASEMLAELVRVRTHMNPLPTRFQRVATLPDGRLLCDDLEAHERVAIRLLCSPVTEAELAHQRRVIAKLARPILEPSLRDFRNEHFVGIVGPMPGDPTLADRFARLDLREVDGLKLLCEVMAEVCVQLDAAHARGVVHGLLSPLAITLPGSGTRVHELGLAPVVRLRQASGNADDFCEAFRLQLAFASPQLRSGDEPPGPLDDVYSVGAILDAVLSGRPPVSVLGPQSAPDHQMEQRLRPGRSPVPVGPNRQAAQIVDPAPNPILPERLLTLVRSCLDADPVRRPPGLAVVAAMLREIRWPEDAVEALCADALRLYPHGAGSAALIDACNRIDQALRLDPGNPRAHFTRGMIYVRNGAYVWAAKDFDKAARVSPTAEVYVLLGEAYENAGQPSQAESAYRQALNLSDDSSIRERLEKLEHRRAPRPTPPTPSPAASGWPETRPPVVTIDHVAPARTCQACGGSLPPPIPGWSEGGICQPCSSNPATLIERVLGRRGHSIVKELGRGGMGVVYLTRHEQTGTLQAVKTLHPQLMVGSRMADHFNREVANTRVLSHPNCVALRESFVIGNLLFYSMEYCDGGSVEDLRKRAGGKISFDEAAEILIQALTGLHYAHTLDFPHVRRGDGQQARGLVHRDLKPHNLFLTGTGSSRVVKIGDFGLAKIFDLAGASGNTATGMTGGTPFFMPRQQVLDYKYAEPDVDVWAMAATFYYLVAGVPARNFTEGRPKLQVVLEDAPVPLLKRCPTIPPRVAELIDLALNDRHGLVFRSAASFREQFELVV